MKRRYVVCFDSIDDEKSKNITACLKENGLGWWHWIDNVWFVTDPRGKFSAVKIRDMLRNYAEDERMVVLEINQDGDTWAGVRAKDPDEKMFKWFVNTWNKSKK